MSTPSLAALLETAPRNLSTSKSRIIVWFESLPEADQLAFVRWMRNGLAPVELYRQCLSAGCPAVADSSYFAQVAKRIANNYGEAR
ncbi:MAG: hypothetical protein KDA89_25305 [Planctomycetaceae bacterium]|nr:hypothetical protein [Planctomycetaceae bacterium]